MSASDHMPNLATLVTESQRLAFLPRLFGPHYLHVEAGTYDWMRQLAPDYTGGCWEFMTLSNDGGYLRPEAGPWLLQVDGNGFRGTLSHDAAGIVVTLFTLSHLSFRFPESVLAERYHALYRRPFPAGRDEHHGKRGVHHAACAN